MTQEVVKTVCQIVAEKLGLSAETVSIHSSLQRDLKVDSLDALEILQAINAQFKLQLTPQQLAPVETVGELVSLVDQLVGGKA